MIKNIMTNKRVIKITALSLALSTTFITSAFAINKGGIGQGAKVQPRANIKMSAKPISTPGAINFKMRTPMEALVKAGTITEAQRSSVISALEAARTSNKSVKEVLDGLVSAKTITSVQEEAILKEVPMGHGHEGGPFRDLISAGTITAAQETAIKTAMDAARGTNKTMKDILGGLVMAGTITAAQEEAILKAAPQGGIGHRGDEFANLVTAGTITVAQKTAVINALDTARGTNKTIKEVLDGLVTAGTISAAQETTIINGMKQMNEFNGEHGPRR